MKQVSLKRTSLTLLSLLSLMMISGVAFAQDDESSDWDWTTLGEETFTATCMACHQATGEGIPGAFPPLAKNLPRYAAVEGGREYIINAILFGIVGEVEVLEQTYNSSMPAWGPSLSDEQVAAVLNHELHSWGNDEMLPEDFSVISVEEVAAEREVEKTQEEVFELREALDFTAAMDKSADETMEEVEEMEEEKDEDSSEEKSDS